MIYRNETSDAAGQVVYAEIIDTTARTVSIEENGQITSTRPFTAAENQSQDATNETARLTANRDAINQAIAAAISKLDTLIAAPALGTVPAGTLTTAQLSTALRTLRDGAQATRAGAQDVALILKQTIKLVRGDYDSIT